jgi:site-specific recombinase XerD
MSPTKRETTTSGRYDQSLHNARDKHLPPGFVSPRPTTEWPKENVELLERYVEWLRGGGASEEVIRLVYIPMAGHVLGLNLKPHPQIDLESDLQKAMDYVVAKGPGPDWTDICCNALAKFKRFLINDRGMLEIKYTPFDPARYASFLPAWLFEELERYQHLKQGNWNQRCMDTNTRGFWNRFCVLWRYFCEVKGVREINDLTHRHLVDYAEMRLATGHKPTGVNSDIRSLHEFFRFLQEDGYEVPQSLFRWTLLKEPDRLPKFLTDEQIRRLQNEFEARVSQANSASTIRNTLLDRAWFYLLWQSGLRRGEVEDLLLEDLDLSGKQLTIRNAKGMKDRTVCMAETTVKAVQEYLEHRGMGPTEHVFLYRNQPLSKDLIFGRLKMIGESVGVKVYPHRLRHTCATQLLNAGCRITTIQRLLGHKELNSTMIYARVHDVTIANDYYAAMKSIERDLELVEAPVGIVSPSGATTLPRALSLVEQLFAPQLSDESRLEIAGALKVLLSREESVYRAMDIVKFNNHPP